MSDESLRAIPCLGASKSEQGAIRRRRRKPNFAIYDFRQRGWMGVDEEDDDDNGDDKEDDDDDNNVNVSADG